MPPQKFIFSLTEMNGIAQRKVIKFDAVFLKNDEALFQVRVCIEINRNRSNTSIYII